MTLSLQIGLDELVHVGRWKVLSLMPAEDQTALDIQIERFRPSLLV